MKLGELQPKTEGIPLLARKSWVKLAKHQLAKRKKIFGEQANVCEGCLEILLCEGPVSLQVCQALDEMIQTGVMSGPKKIPYSRIRRRFLPVSTTCLAVYSVKVEGNKLVVLGNQ